MPRLIFEKIINTLISFVGFGCVSMLLFADIENHNTVRIIVDLIIMVGIFIHQYISYQSYYYNMIEFKYTEMFKEKYDETLYIDINIREEDDDYV